MNILVTGGLGFIGSHFVEHIYRNTDMNIYIIDKLSYASKGFDRLRSMGLYNNSRITVFTCDLIQPLTVGVMKELGDIHYIIHMASETHVDNSIQNPIHCISNNIECTLNILEYARKLSSLKLFIYFSTDEVYGSAPVNKSFIETDRRNPSNPYSASKSAAEQIVVSYYNTFQVPFIIMNVMNVFGERQHVEKFIPKVIQHLLHNKEIGIHVDQDKHAGSRHYIHARNISDAVLFLLHQGTIGETYNISGHEIDNLQLAQTIADILGKPLNYKLVQYDKNRPGHDIRYALDDSKLKELGWKQPLPFAFTLSKTIAWTLKHPEWLIE